MRVYVTTGPYWNKPWALVSPAIVLLDRGSECTVRVTDNSGVILVTRDKRHIWLDSRKTQPLSEEKGDK